MGGDARQSALRCRANGCKQGAKGDGEYGEREEEAGRGRRGGGATSLPAAPFRPTPEALSLPPGGGTSLPPDAGGALAGAGAGAWAGGKGGACMGRGERGGIRIGADSDARGDRTNLETHAGLRRRFACSTYVSERMNLSRERNI